MRFSKAFIPTQKDLPRDATLASHILLLRAGFIASSASGLYSYLPLGKRVLKKITDIINDEMANIGAQEVDLSFVTPASLWEKSGRIEKFGKELLRFKDRKNNTFVLGPTHEEMMVDLVKNRITSYKQLPLNLYQIKTKFRDEVRPRFGLMRSREFIMKDGYSFHANNDDLDREFDAVESAYRRILEQLGLKYRIVIADSGSIGGTASKELMVLAQSGEDTVVVCDSCDYGANIEAATTKKQEPPKEPDAKTNKFKTVDITTVEQLCNTFHVDPFYILKTVAKKAIYSDSTELVLFFIRGCDELQETKALNATGATELVDIDENELLSMGLFPGYIGPPDLTLIQCHFDESVRDATNMICGANEQHYHFVGADLSILENASFSDLKQAKEGDRCSCCKDGKLLYTKGIEVGHIFKLGTTYSKALGANFLDKDGRSEPFIMGTYGMGVSRLVAAIVEQHNDKDGCIWSKNSAPYVVNILISNIKNGAQMALGEALYKELKAEGIDVIIDDRKERFGFKMRDAELIGFPFTLIIGKELESGKVELFDRSSKTKTAYDVKDITSAVVEQIG